MLHLKRMTRRVRFGVARKKPVLVAELGNAHGNQARRPVARTYATAPPQDPLVQVGVALCRQAGGVVVAMVSARDVHCWVEGSHPLLAHFKVGGADEQDNLT